MFPGVNRQAAAGRTAGRLAVGLLRPEPVS